jgi:Uma2 family endonuclease
MDQQNLSGFSESTIDLTNFGNTWTGKLTSSAFPVCALDNNIFQVRIKFRNAADCINYFGTTAPSNDELPVIANSYLLVDYVYLETEERNFDLIGQLWMWTRQDGTGVGFGSSGGFMLPNGAVRSPDAAWIKKSRWEAIPQEQRQTFAPICPDFVVELRSASDRLKLLQEKMLEYIENGAILGWLIDPIHKQVYIYRPQTEIECLENPATVSGDPVLSGFVLDLNKIFSGISET